jgi:hypothetical protein
MNTIFIAGHAKLPEGMAVKSKFETLTITAEIDKKYGVIVNASCTLATNHAGEYVSHLLRGYSLQDGIDEPLQVIKERYFGKAANSISAALKDLFKQYKYIQTNER